MAKHRQFLEQLENLRHEANTIAQLVYAEMAINHAASTSKRLRSRLNHTALFWVSCVAALQQSAYIALGRVFDRNSRFNLEALLNSFEESLSEFGSKALAARKRDALSEDPWWLDELVKRAYVPNQKDVAVLRARVLKKREIFDRAIKRARNKHIAHREYVDASDVSDLYGSGTVKDLWMLSTFLLRLHEALWQLYHNGRRPVFRIGRYSIKSLFRTSDPATQPHERVVGEVKRLMHFIESAQPASALAAR
jgi:hypothetical protein